ncbi:MAG: phosphoribosylaminoimidazole-succinocarboxamide synthase [Porticoccaceae bacterium]|nr:MAG: phosphoribosylaminoimidazole-succinocarboxamide synthase [Porticoccaceae bacterium]
MHKGEPVYSGKAKSLYATDDPRLMVMEFRDDTSAFDGQKVARLARKGMVNNYLNAFLMERLAAAGIPTHFVRRLSATRSLVKRLAMVPLECVVRNRAAGSLCRRLGVEEGRVLSPPTFELFLKNDALHDPLVNEYHAVTFGWADRPTLARMVEQSFRVNELLSPLFADAGLVLVDFKLEFGWADGELVLGDELSPDGCRIWDAASGEKLDKDRFRKDLGRVVESYEEIAARLGVPLPASP